MDQTDYIDFPERTRQMRQTPTHFKFTDADRVRTADALEVLTNVHFTDRSTFRGIANRMKLHERFHLDTDAVIVDRKFQDGELMLYELRFDDFCKTWEPPWSVAAI